MSGDKKEDSPYRRLVDAAEREQERATERARAIRALQFSGFAYEPAYDFVSFVVRDLDDALHDAPTFRVNATRVDGTNSWIWSLRGARYDGPWPVLLQHLCAAERYPIEVGAAGTGTHYSLLA